MWSYSAAFASTTLTFDTIIIETETRLRRIDRLVSPRAGIVIKPVTPLSVYAQLRRLLFAELRRSVFFIDQHHAAGQT